MDGSRTGLRLGEWRLLDCTGWPDNPTHHNLLAWGWRADSSHHIVVVNLSDRPAQAHVPLPWTDVPGGRWRLSELLGDAEYDRGGDELVDPGLFVALDGWGWHVLSLAR